MLAATRGDRIMLSRTADHLYWMARYTERAENLARMLEVNYRMSLLPQGAEIVEQGWTATLTIIGLLDAFKQRYDAVTPSERDRVPGVRSRKPDEHLQLRARCARERARRARHADLGNLGNAQRDLAGNARREHALGVGRRDGQFLRMGEAPLASHARRHSRHDAARRGLALHVARHVSRALATARRAFST